MPILQYHCHRLGGRKSGSILADAALHTGQAVNESERSIARRSGFGLTVWWIAMVGVQLLEWVIIAARCDSYESTTDMLGVIATMIHINQ